MIKVNVYIIYCNYTCIVQTFNASTGDNIKKKSTSII